MQQKKDFIFDGRNYKQFAVDAIPLDTNKDGIFDTYLIAYDLNKNGKVDHMAKYKSFINSNKITVFRHYPFELYHDEDEDGIPEYRHLDKDGDGIMESGEPNPNFKKKYGKKI